MIPITTTDALEKTAELLRLFVTDRISLEALTAHTMVAPPGAPPTPEAPSNPPLAQASPATRTVGDPPKAAATTTDNSVSTTVDPAREEAPGPSPAQL